MKVSNAITEIFSSMVLALLVGGCLSAGKYPAADIDSPKDTLSADTYFASAPSGVSREKELSDCLFLVAGQVSMRERVEVRYTVSKSSSGNAMVRSELGYDQDYSVELLDRMQVLDIAQTGNGTSAVVRVTGKSRFTVPRASIDDRAGKDGLPGWIAKVPKGNSFYAAVGSVRVTSSPASAPGYADMNAIGALLPLVTEPSESGSTKTYSKTLHGAFIARRWYDPGNDLYYSLAILPR